MNHRTESGIPSYNQLMPSLRILTWNLWHGLNPYQRLRMSPMETQDARARRHQAQIETIRRWQRGDCDILCFQEVNPIPQRFDALSDALDLQGGACLSNSGVKLAGLGLPPGLREGLAIFHGQGLSDAKFEQLTLSGSALQLGVPGRAPLLTYQTGERRMALLLEARLAGHPIAILNLHLHHGPDTLAPNLERKRAEVTRLCEWLRPRMQHWELSVVCGDFNCDPTSTCLEPLRALGFEHAADLTRTIQPPTWAPAENSAARSSARLADRPETAEWDAAAHIFDRFYLNARFPLAKVSFETLRKPELSDHYAVGLEIEY